MASAATLYTPTAGLCALSPKNNDPHWYDYGSAAWRQLVYHDPDADIVPKTTGAYDLGDLTHAFYHVYGNVFWSAGYSGGSSTGVKFITDIDVNPGAGIYRYKSRLLDFRGGIVTSIGAESAWFTYYP